jgi:hypothetical protein
MKWLQIILGIVLAWLNRKRPSELELLRRETGKKVKAIDEEIEKAKKLLAKALSYDAASAELNYWHKRLSELYNQRQSAYAVLGEAFYRARRDKSSDD